MQFTRLSQFLRSLAKLCMYFSLPRAPQPISCSECIHATYKSFINLMAYIMILHICQPLRKILLAKKLHSLVFKPSAESFPIVKGFFHVCWSSKLILHVYFSSLRVSSTLVKIYSCSAEPERTNQFFWKAHCMIQTFKSCIWEDNEVIQLPK